MGDTLVDPVARAAIAWWVKLQSGEGGAATLNACRRWRAADPRHENAWAHLEALAQAVRDIPSDFAHAHLVGARTGTGNGTGTHNGAGNDIGTSTDNGAGTTRPANTRPERQRRAVIKAMAGVVALGGAGAVAYEWTPWQRVVADYSTRVGERRRLVLPDDVQMDLASDTAVSSAFRAGQHQLTLWRGEIGIAVHHDDGAAPLLVTVDGARVEALNARFSLWRRSSGMRVDVYEGTLRVNAQGAESRLMNAGAALYRKGDVWREAAAQPGRAAWMEGLLVANGDRLSVVVAQLARYRRGIVSVSPDVADLSVSGVFPLDDTDRALDMLQHVLPITIRRWGPWWVRVDDVRERTKQANA